MRSRFVLAAAALVALAATARAADPVITYEVRVVTVPADAATACGARVPAKEGDALALTDAQLRGLLDTLQGVARAKVMQTPRMTIDNGQEATARVVERQLFVTGL